MDSLKNLLEKREIALSAGGFDKIQKQHKQNKLSARERIEVLFDKGSFEEYGIFVEHNCNDFGMADKKSLGDGVVTGCGTIYGRKFYVYSQDFTVIGGSLGKAHANKINKIQDLALRNKIPIICINDSGGARIQEGIDSLAGYGEIFQRNVLLSGVVPQISLIIGPCAGGAVYSPALTDFVFMTRDTSYMFVTGPDVVKTVTYEDISLEDLGGAEVHETKSGVADLVFNDEISMLKSVRNFTMLLPSSNLSPSPVFKDKKYQATRSYVENSDGDNLVPSDPNKPYNIKQLINKIADDGFFEIKPNYAKNIVIGLGRVMGSVVGFVANQPMELAGCLDIKSSQKAARFIRFCDAFNIPLVTLIDVPGFLPGSDQEHDGIIKHGAKLLYAYAEATVPKVSVALRKAYGGAYIVMSSKHLGGDINYCLHNSEIAVMGAKGAAEIIFRNSKNKQEDIDNFIKKSNWESATKNGYIDDVIRPSNMRWRIARALDTLKDKKSFVSCWKKHDNLPL